MSELEGRGSGTQNRPPAVAPDSMSAPAPATAVQRPAIRLVGVRKAFRRHLSLGSVPVLHGLSLDVVAGAIHGLLGPNGAGKTTTLRILLGLIRADAGTVEIGGIPASDPASRRGLGFLPENPWFYDYLTGREFLDFSARLAGVAAAGRDAEVTRLIDRVGMSDRADTPLRRCSKGMVQRIGMAQALLGDPGIVILDEPMSGLDPVGRREFRDLILEQRAAGCTVFFSSHILQDAEMICDRVTILDRGRVAAQGELASLLGREVRFWEVSLLGVDPSALIGRVEVIRRSGREMIARVHSEEDLDILLRAAVDRGGRVRSVTPCRDTLEDLFLRETRGAAGGSAAATATGARADGPPE